MASDPSRRSPHPITDTNSTPSTPASNSNSPSSRSDSPMEITAYIQVAQPESIQTQPLATTSPHTSPQTPYDRLLSPWHSPDTESKTIVRFTVKQIVRQGNFYRFVTLSESAVCDSSADAVTRETLTQFALTGSEHAHKCTCKLQNGRLLYVRLLQLGTASQPLPGPSQESSGSSPPTTPPSLTSATYDSGFPSNSSNRS